MSKVTYLLMDEATDVTIVSFHQLSILSAHQNAAGDV
jgi:hypothetical protein